MSPLFKKIIIEEQQGFIWGRPTATNLQTFQHYILDAFKLGNQFTIYKPCLKFYLNCNIIFFLCKLYTINKII
jgi:hypothetical protein